MISPPKSDGRRQTGAIYRHSRLDGSFTREVLGNASIVFTGNVLARGLGFVTTWILVRRLQPEEYGVFSVLDMIAGFSAGFLATGLNWSMIRSVSACKSQPAKAWNVAKTVLKIELVYGIIVASAIYFAADVIASSVLKKPELLSYVRLASIGVLGALLLSYRSAIFQAWMRFKLDAAFTLVQSGSYLLIIVALLMGGVLGIRIVSMTYVGLPLAISGLALISLKRELGEGRKEHFPNILRSLGPSYIWLLCYTLCLWVSGQVHIVVLTRFFDLKEVGLYGFAYKMYGFSLLMMESLKVVLLPSFSEIADREALRLSFLRVLKVMSLVALLFVLSAPFLGTFVRIFAGEGYGQSTGMLQLLILGAAASTVLSPSSTMLMALNKPWLMAKGGIVLLATNVAGHLLITARFGGMGAASVQMISHIALNGCFTIWVWRALRTTEAVTA